MSHLDTLLVIVVFDEGSASNSCVVVVIPRVIFYEGFDFLYEVRLVDIADLVGADIEIFTGVRDEPLESTLVTHLLFSEEKVSIEIPSCSLTLFSETVYSASCCRSPALSVSNLAH